MTKNISELVKSYKIRKNEIKKKLKEFKKVLNQSDERIFAELAFCICTPQSKAIAAWNAITALMKNNLLFSGSAQQIRPFLNVVRFADNKSKYIVEARNFFTKNSRLKIKEKICSFKNAFELRNWLIENVKGIGIKEASHFIRNIGFNYENQLAILDRHILKNLKEFGVVDKLPNTLTKKKYFEIEDKMRRFSEKIKIPMYELDMLLWSKETGKVFK
jgi:N-glycosylase/DNA lyase